MARRRNQVTVSEAGFRRAVRRKIALAFAFNRVPIARSVVSVQHCRSVNQRRRVEHAHRQPAAARKGGLTPRCRLHQGSQPRHQHSGEDENDQLPHRGQQHRKQHKINELTALATVLASGKLKTDQCARKRNGSGGIAVTMSAISLYGVTLV